MRVAIRVDASVDMGVGHLMRCLALADAMQDRGSEITIISRYMPAALIAQVTGRGHQFFLQDTQDEGQESVAHWNVEFDILQTLDILGRVGRFDVMIVDHYALDYKWEQVVRQMVDLIVVIDDLADRRHECDVLIDQNCYPDLELRYDALVPSACVKLLGPKYAMLRSEFESARQTPDSRDGSVRRILIFFGGTDAGGETIRSLQVLKEIARHDIALDVVVGAANTRALEVKALCSHMENTHFHCQVDNMSVLMENADLCIGAGGTTTWERCCLGLPAIVIAIADNQRPGAEELARRGVVIYLGSSENSAVPVLKDAINLALHNPYLLTSLTEKGRALIDGRGLQRVLKNILREKIEIREVVKADCDAIFQWRNHVETRRNSFDQAPLSKETHDAWFFNSLLNPDRKILIGAVRGDPVGVLRYDLQAHSAMVSIYLVPGKTGKGYGASLLRAARLWLHEERPEIRILEAHIREGNAASIAVFGEDGFKLDSLVFRRVAENG